MKKTKEELVNKAFSTGVSAAHMLKSQYPDKENISPEEALQRKEHLKTLSLDELNEEIHKNQKTLTETLDDPDSIYGQQTVVDKMFKRIFG